MSGRAQTIVYATPKRPPRKQRVVARANRLPNGREKQQDFATKSPLIGYARVSKTDGQDLTPQISALEAAACHRVYEEKASRGHWDRPELNRLIEGLHTADVLVVWKLDRLPRSLKDLLLTLERIEAAGARFRSLTEAIDTTTSAGRTMMQMPGSFAEYERVMVRERTQAGLREANAQRRHGGRKPKFSSTQRTEILGMLAAGRSAAKVARLFRVHRATVSRINATARTASTVS